MLSVPAPALSLLPQEGRGRVSSPLPWGGDCSTGRLLPGVWKDGEEGAFGGAPNFPGGTILCK